MRRLVFNSIKEATMPSEHVCVICRTLVSKRQSYAIPGRGRACKVHQEAQQAAQESAIEKRKQLQTRKQDAEMGIQLRDPHTYYWHCDESGVSELKLHAALLKNCMEVEKVDGRVPNVLNPADPVWRKTAESIGYQAIFRHFTLPNKFPEWKIRQLCSTAPLRDLADIAKQVVLCFRCAEEFGFDWDTGELKSEKAKGPTKTRKEYEDGRR